MTTRSVLAHRIDGKGEPVLLLNGGFMTIASWDGIASRLAERYRVVRFDFRGQLRSPGPPPADLQGHVEDIAALLDELHIERVLAVGTSFGAEVGLLLAATRPARVGALVAATATDVATPALAHERGEMRVELERAAAGGDRRPLLRLMQDLLYSPDYVAAHRDELARRAEQAVLLPDWWFAGGAALLASLASLDLRPHLGRVACPVLVLAASGDRIMPLDRARALAAAIPQAVLHVLDGSGHVLVVEQPERFADACLDFLASVPRYG